MFNTRRANRANDAARRVRAGASQIIHALLRIAIFLSAAQDARSRRRRPGARRRHHRRRPSRRHAVHAHLRHDGHRRVREADARTRRRRLPARPHHRADGEGRGQPAEHRRRTARSAAASCRSSPTSISSPKPRWKRRNGSRWCASIPAITPTRRNSPSRNTPTSNTPPSWSASRRSSRRWCWNANELKRALRIGTNHGSLSDRIMNRYGDTPLGMVESALEFARICRKHDFHNFKFSMKSCNPKVMIECYRLLVARLEQEGPDWNYPDSPRRHRSRRRRGRPHQERHRHRLAAVRRPGRHHPRFAHGRFAARNRGLPRFAGADSRSDRARRRPARLADRSACGLRRFPSTRSLRRAAQTPEIELADGVKCGGEQLIRVVVTRATWDKVAPKIRPEGRREAGSGLRRSERCRD